MKYYMNEQGLLVEEKELYLGLYGIEDIIKGLDSMRETLQELQDRYLNFEKIYHSNMQNMLEKLV